MKRQDLYYIIACISLIIASLSMKVHSKEVNVPLLQAIESIPLKFGEFIGTDDYPSDRNYHDASADKWIFRIYTKRGEDNQIRIFVGYWESQNEKKRIRPPRYTTNGWGYYWIRTKTVTTVPGSRTLFKEFLNERGQDKELVYYCYIIDGRFIPDEYRFRFLRMVNSLFHGKSNAALLRISVPVSIEFPVESAEIYIEDFINVFLPLLKNYLPK